VLGDKVPCARMQRAGEKRRKDQVSEGGTCACAHKEIVKCELGQNVDEVDRGKGDFVDEYRSHSIKEDLECAKERFP
jgi:hypothetical protein